jgi:transposase-like protein
MQPHSGDMKDTNSERKKAERSEYWREQIAQHERSGLSVPEFCKERGIVEQSFYVWRKRLREQGPMRFALVEAVPVEREPRMGAGLELVLARGERLRIGADVDLMLLRRVLEVLRA